MASLKNIAIIGSTGSIGRQTLEVIRSFPGRFHITALAAGRNTVLLSEQVDEFKPEYVFYEGANKDIGDAEFIPLRDIVSLDEIDIVVMAPSGLAGLKPTLWAGQAGKTIALANKESLVMAGNLIIEETRKHSGKILPVDSEHSAIWQCLKGERKPVEKIILTASGGPFFNYSPTKLDTVTPEQALRHPSWLMGPKVTIDSATLLNKGLEVIEAHHLFNVSYSQIDVLIHPPSLIHSLIEFKDGSVKAQLSYPDMRLPIQYALSYPKRWVNRNLPHIDWTLIKNLPIEKPDTSAFPCLKLAYDAGRGGGTYPAALCGAGEACVQMFLNKKIRFTQIGIIIEQVLNEHKPAAVSDIEAVEETAKQAWSRAFEISRKRD